MDTIHLKNLQQNIPPPQPVAPIPAQPANPGLSFSLKEKVLIILGFLVFLYVFFVVLDANKYQAQVFVVEGAGKVGVNPTTERLDFGDLSRGSSAVRRVRIKNSTPVPMWVTAMSLGEIADVVKTNPNHFVLAPNSEQEIEFTAYMPASAPIGQYIKGRVYLFKVPGPWPKGQ